jgi:transposase
MCVTVRPVIWIGIDVGKTTHHACAMDAAGKVLFSRQVTNDQAAIEQLVTQAGRTAVEVR